MKTIYFYHTPDILCLLSDHSTSCFQLHTIFKTSTLLILIRVSTWTLPYGHPWSVGNLEESTPLKKTDSPGSVMVKFNCQVDFEPPRNHTYEHFLESRHACVFKSIYLFLEYWCLAGMCVCVPCVHRAREARSHR